MTGIIATVRSYFGNGSDQLTGSPMEPSRQAPSLARHESVIKRSLQEIKKCFLQREAIETRLQSLYRDFETKKHEYELVNNQLTKVSWKDQNYLDLYIKRDNYSLNCFILDKKIKATWSELGSVDQKYQQAAVQLENTKKEMENNWKPCLPALSKSYSSLTSSALSSILNPFNIVRIAKVCFFRG